MILSTFDQNLDYGYCCSPKQGILACGYIHYMNYYLCLDLLIYNFIPS